MRIITVFVMSAFMLSPGWAQEVSEAQAAMMEAWQKYATPGEAHAELAKSEGHWHVILMDYSDPSNPTESKGCCRNTMVLGGRYLKQDFVSEYNGMPFEGVGYTAYDNILKQYISTWIDNFSTGLAVLRGEMDESGKVLTSFGEGPDPMTGKIIKYKSVMTVKDDDHHLFEMFILLPDGQEMKTMSMSYERTQCTKDCTAKCKGHCKAKCKQTCKKPCSAGKSDKAEPKDGE